MIYKLILFPLYLFSLLPLKLLYVFSDCFAFLLRKVLGYRSSVVYINLARSFPDLKYEGINKIAKDFYRYFTDLFFESLWSISASREQIFQKVEIENPEVLDEAYRKYGKVIIVMGHQSNEELISCGLCQPQTGKETEYQNAGYIFIYKKLKNKILCSIMESYRKAQYKKFGNNGTIVDSHNFLNYVFEHEEDSNLYFFMADQAGKKDSKFVVNFLNQPSLMLGGPESLARAMNIPVVYLGTDRYRRGQYKITFTLICEKGVETKRGYITKTFASLLEKSINANKACWLWTHKRWKIDLKEITHRLYYLDDGKDPGEQ